MPMRIARLTPDDLDRGYENCLLFWKMPSSSDNLRQFLNDDDNILIVAEEDGTPVGQAIGYVLRRWDAKAPKLFLYSIDVREEYRQQGVGKNLIEAIRAIGREYGCGLIFVPTSEQNAAAVRLYESAGGVRNADARPVTFEWTED